MELRSVNIQHDSMRFRRNLERIGEVFAYEISKTLTYSNVTIQSPLGSLDSVAPEKIVLANILRAALPLHQGLLNYFDSAESMFISASRLHEKTDDSDVAIEYIAGPSIDKKTVILADPMLATGQSMLLAREALFKNGLPKHLHLVSVISSQYAVDELLERLSGTNFTLWIGAIDPILDENAYIVPGLGDAGDLAYGLKI